MALNKVADILPHEAARACLERAYPLAVQACMPPAGVPFLDPDTAEPYAGPEDLRTSLVQQFDVEVCKLLGLPFVEGYDLSPVGEVVA